jgi:hypothetical protein
MKTEDLLVESFSIKTPGELLSLLADLKENFLDKGLLVQVEGLDPVDELIQLIKEKRWPEYIDLTFETIPERTQFKLMCNSERGGGWFGKAAMQPPNRLR